MDTTLEHTAKHPLKSTNQIINDKNQQPKETWT